MTRFAAVVGLTLAAFTLAPAAHADVYSTFDFTANNTADLFGKGPGSFTLFGTFTVDDTTQTTYTSDFWVQQVGASNGEFSNTDGEFSILDEHNSPDTLTGNTFEIQGFDATDNNIILSFQQNLFSVTTGTVDQLEEVDFDNGSSFDDSPVGGVCIQGTCPASAGGDAPENPAQEAAPEPASIALLGGGLSVLGWIRRRKSRA